MPHTLADLRNILNELVSDPKDQKWTQAIKNRRLNAAIQDEISSETKSYVRAVEIPIRDGEIEYSFPEDMLEPAAMMIQSIDGSLVIPSAWNSLIGNVGLSSLLPYDSGVFWQVENNFSGSITLRDIVSDDKFIFSPKYVATDYSGNVLSQVNIPTSGALDDIWVDTKDGLNYVYKLSEPYGVVTAQATVTVDSGLRPSSTDLVFTSDTVGLSYTKVIIKNGGVTGTASVSTSGDVNDRSNPWVIEFTLYDDDCSNDSVIALAPIGLTVTGSDATNGTFYEVEATLENLAEGYWERQNIHLQYIAQYPALGSDADTLRSEIPTIIRNGDCIPLIAACKLLQGLKGDERTIVMYRTYKKEYQYILERAHAHRMGSGPSLDLEPA